MNTLLGKNVKHTENRRNLQAKRFKNHSFVCYICSMRQNIILIALVFMCSVHVYSLISRPLPWRVSTMFCVGSLGLGMENCLGTLGSNAGLITCVCIMPKDYMTSTCQEDTHSSYIFIWVMYVLHASFMKRKPVIFIFICAFSVNIYDRDHMVRKIDT